MLKRYTSIVCLCVAMVLTALCSQGQDMMQLRNLSNYRVDLLTDADLLKIRQQLSAQNVTIDQVRPLLISRGLPLAEFSKLKTRLQSSSSNAKTSRTTLKASELRQQKNQKQVLDKDASLMGFFEEDSLNAFLFEEMRKPLIDPRIFGAELFNQAKRNEGGLETDVFNMATPVNYELGPGDLIKLVVYGQQEYQDELEVSRDGQINVENVGLIRVSGMTIEAAASKLKQSMSRAYPTLSTGTSKLNLSLGEIRTIQVTVVGANRSGTINVPSLYTIYGAIAMAGGPTNIGSFRNIELVRNSKVIQKIDLYKLLAKGDQSDNVRLRDNDIIRIPAYANRVELSGQVKRQGLYEVLPNESFSDVLAFAGGFDDTAYTASVKVIRKGDREREVKDLVANQFSVFKPVSGDQYLVNRILDRFSNRVRISGAVYRPDIYEFVSGMRIADLVSKADGPSDDAFLERALLVRQKQDMTKEMRSIHLGKALAHDPAHDLELRREDELIVSSIIDMKDSLKVTLQGEVHLPGDYLFVEGMTLKGLILQAGGFTDASSANIEVAHLIVRDAVNSTDIRTSKIENIQLTDTLAFNDLDVPLKAYDVVTVRKKPAYNKLQSVLVVGQVQFPGPYALENANERVSDLYKRVGGLLPDGNLSGAYLKRYKSADERKRIAEDARRLQTLISDSSSSILRDVEKEYDKIPLNMEEILRNPGSTADVILQSRDELIIPKTDLQVRISGSVLQSTQIPYESGKSFRSYISSAGGFSKDAWKRSAYIVYANGRASTTRRFLLFRYHPRVQPGAEIIVPREPPSKSRVSATEFIGISSAIASLAGVVIALLRL
jgi:protein involved in polysaccharide export with SLBB domain